MRQDHMKGETVREPSKVYATPTRGRTPPSSEILVELLASQGKQPPQACRRKKQSDKTDDSYHHRRSTPRDTRQPPVGPKSRKTAHREDST